MNYILGLDLGQIADFTALAILERQQAARVWAVRHLERTPLQTPYQDIVKHVKRLVSRWPLQGDCSLAFDETGVGKPVGDYLRKERIGCPIYGITLHGGDAVTRGAVAYSFRVPKRDIVSAVQLLLQQRRLKIARRLRFAEILLKEMANFRVQVSLETAHDSYSAWRSGDHDDLVLAVGLACWLGERFSALPPGPPEGSSPPSQKMKDFFDFLNSPQRTNPDEFAVGGEVKSIERDVRTGGWRIKTSK
jgi:hypothetical protein